MGYAACPKQEIAAAKMDEISDGGSALIHRTIKAGFPQAQGEHLDFDSNLKPCHSASLASEGRIARANKRKTSTG